MINVEPATPALVSIITVCLNANRTLARCIDSVVNQTYQHTEYIIVDGGSTDGTLEIIQDNLPNIDHWVSEKDGGISDAFNKGIALAQGDYYIMVNADDWLEPEAITRLLDNSADAIVSCGVTNIVDANSGYLQRRCPRPNLLRTKSSIVHGACLIRRNVHEVVGNYRVDRRIAMDHAFFMEILSHFGLSAFRTIDTTVVNFSMGGASDKNALRGFFEVSLNLKEHDTPAIVALYRLLVLGLKHYVVRGLRSLPRQIIRKRF